MSSSMRVVGTAMFLCVTSAACGGSSSTGSGGSGGSASGPSTTSTGATGATSTGAGTASTGSSSSTGGGGVMPAGWLYTSGNSILLSDGTSGAPWTGRGVNMDDLFLCGYNNTLWMTGADVTVGEIATGLVSGWKPTFVRISLSMASNPTTVSWLANDAQYKTPMTGVIQTLAHSPNVYVLVSLRSDASMIGQDMVDGDPEATGLPSDSTTTPNATAFPTGTDAVYQAMVQSFANESHVLFGITNEPGGNKLSNAQIAAAMSHAVSVIRAEEDKLGVPHHIVSVQGNGWTSDISFYASAPLSQDNVVYEIHGYPPAPSSYTYANLPVIIGEYGSLDAGSAPAFYADVEAKHIPNLAWDFDPYSNCAPDLLNVNQSSTNLVPSAWGSIVQSYLLSH